MSDLRRRATVLLLAVVLGQPVSAAGLDSEAIERELTRDYALGREKADIVTVRDFLEFDGRNFTVTNAVGDFRSEPLAKIHNIGQSGENVGISLLGTENSFNSVHTVAVFLSDKSPEMNFAAGDGKTATVVLTNPHGKLRRFTGTAKVTLLAGTRVTVSVESFEQTYGDPYKLQSQRLRAEFDTLFSNNGDAYVYAVGDGGRYLSVGGMLGRQSLLKIEKLINEKTDLKAINLFTVYGSVDPELTWRVGRLIRSRKLPIIIAPQASLTSYGLDLLIAGEQRYSYSHANFFHASAECCYARKQHAEFPLMSGPNALRNSYFREMLGADKGSTLLDTWLQLSKADGNAEVDPQKMMEWGAITRWIASGTDALDLKLD